MPKLYEYLGIAIRLLYEDHNPIHVHATCGQNEMRVELYEKDGVIYDVKYRLVKGKFTPAQKRNLQAIIEEKKDAILFAWDQSKRQNGDIKFKPTKITKRIKA